METTREALVRIGHTRRSIIVRAVNRMRATHVRAGACCMMGGSDVEAMREWKRIEGASFRLWKFLQRFANVENPWSLTTPETAELDHKRTMKLYAAMKAARAK